jgi:hypothetical protein
LIVSPVADEIRHDIHQKAIDIIFEILLKKNISPKTHQEL